MARIIVTPDQTDPGETPVLLDESVYSVHLSTGHAAAQLIERLSWALDDAEAIERARSSRSSRRPARARATRSPASRSARTDQRVQAQA
jgi:hypothetical protein